MRQLFLLGCLAAACAAWADEPPQREKLAGTWESSDGARWVLDAKDDAIHVSEFDHDRKLADFECNTMGKQCEIKDAGKSAKITMYFNGPMLVVMETRGNDVVKRRFRANGDQLQVETMPLVPAGKTETAKLARK